MVGKRGEGMLRCGLCVRKDVVEVRNENEKLKREMERMKNEQDTRKEAGVYEKNENVKTWVTIAERMTDEKTIEKLERVETGMIVKRSDIRKEVEERSFEERRKRQLILFNLRQSEVKNDSELVWDMIERMGGRVRSEDVPNIIRMRKKNGDIAVKPVIIESFRSQLEK